MPPKTPKEDFFQHGRQLLDDAENSSDPKLAKLRAKMAKRYFKLDLRGSARVSPNIALFLALFVLILFAGICVLVAIKLSGIVFGLVFTACAVFGLIIVLTILALAGFMRDSIVAKVLLGMFDKVIAKFTKSDP